MLGRIPRILGPTARKGPPTPRKIEVQTTYDTHTPTPTRYQIDLSRIVKRSVTEWAKRGGLIVVQRRSRNLSTVVIIACPRPALRNLIETAIGGCSPGDQPYRALPGSGKAYHDTYDPAAPCSLRVAKQCFRHTLGGYDLEEVDGHNPGEELFPGSEVRDAWG